MSNHKNSNINSNSLKDDFENIRDKTLETREAVKVAVNHLSDKAKDVCYDAKDRIKDSLTQMKCKACNAEENVITYVRENPVKAMSIAALVGFIFSRILKD